MWNQSGSSSRGFNNSTSSFRGGSTSSHRGSASSSRHAGRRKVDFRNVYGVEDALYKSWMRVRANHTSGKVKHDVVPKTSIPAAWRDGRFSFWNDIRPPFTVTGMGPVSEEEFEDIVHKDLVTSRTPAEEVFKVEYEAYLNYELERSFGHVENNRLFSTAIVIIPQRYPNCNMEVVSWGYRKTASTFTKTLEWLFKPESKKTYTPTKRLDVSSCLAQHSSAGSTYAPNSSDGLNDTSRSIETQKGIAMEESSYYNMVSPATTVTPWTHDISLNPNASFNITADPAQLSRLGYHQNDTSWVHRSMKQKLKEKSAPSPNLARKMFNNTYAAARNNPTHLSEQFELSRTSHSQLSKKLCDDSHVRKTFYRDPDRHNNTFHAKKMLQTDSVPFYGHRLLSTPI